MIPRAKRAAASRAKTRPAPSVAQTVDAYIASASASARPRLRKLRALVRRLAPKAIEAIAYGMPSYELGGRPLVYFAAFARHIGLYAVPTADPAFAADFARYERGKGSVRLPLDEPMPYELIGRVIAHRVKKSAVTR